MPDFGYMVPMEQRRRLAELYGDLTSDNTTTVVRSGQDSTLGDDEHGQYDPERPQDVYDALVQPERCSSCGYLTSSIGHQITCKDVNP